MRAFSTPTSGARQCVRPARAVGCSAYDRPSAKSSFLDRRAALLTLSSGIALSSSQALVALADDAEAVATPEFTTYYGAASPPTSYGGYGGNVNEAPKYSFERPYDWKMAVVNKVQKGTAGIDSIAYNPKAKTTNKAFVVQLSRAGEDNKSFRLADNETAFYSFSGADSDIQDALESSPKGLQFDSREVNGQIFYDYILEAPSVVYRATITIAFGKVFALFVRATPKQWSVDRKTIDRMMYSFKTLDQN